MQNVLNMPSDLGTPTLTWARRRFRNATQSITRLQTDIAGWWTCRSTVRALQALDDRMLADIGLVRGGIEGAVRHDLRMSPRAVPSEREPWLKAGRAEACPA